MIPAPPPFPLSATDQYANSLAAELRIYQHCLDVHNLPEIFHYWSNRHLASAMRAVGATGPSGMFGQELARQFKNKSAGVRRFVSLGSGNCDFEIALALRLRQQGNTDFLFDCVDLNPAMLERGRLAAGEAGVPENFSFLQGDFNAWRPAGQYHAIVANQSLHHAVNLEGLFEEARRSLLPGGAFIISDIIGRNGHLRWPEALDIVHEFWRTLPPSYRWNRHTHCYEELFADHDCSGDGFEGIRSQDILPLLLHHFNFRFFFPFGNLIDPFIDRTFGPNFNSDRECDRSFIDRVHQRDELDMATGKITPSHMMAVVVNEEEGGCIFPGNLSPAFCLRPPGRMAKTVSFAAPVYQWERWPATAGEELEKTCGMLVESAEMITRQTAWAHGLERESRQRLEWGADLEQQLAQRTEWALELDAETRGRTTWALNLQSELANRTEWVRILEAWAATLQADVEERTEWALRLEQELAERTAWALAMEARLEEQRARADRLNGEIRGYLRNPLRLSVRMFGAARRRFLRMAGR